MSTLGSMFCGCLTGGVAMDCSFFRVFNHYVCILLKEILEEHQVEIETIKTDYGEQESELKVRT